MGIKYRFDVFHAETKTCSSELLVLLENWDLNQDLNLPMDHSVDINEDAEPVDLVAAINLADLFSGNRFDVTIYSGNVECKSVWVCMHSYTFRFFELSLFMTKFGIYMEIENLP